MISYSQNLEDVMIARLFPHEYRGFYIDVGAADPENLSVTCHFYNQGWSGVNVEPVTKFYDRLQQMRPRDITLKVAIGDTPGKSLFFEAQEINENSGLSEQLYRDFISKNIDVNVHTVEVITLENLCDQYAQTRNIDFLKIDVEGTELSVLKSNNWTKYRPLLLIVEAVVVNGIVENWHEWEPFVLSKGYTKVWFDGLNNFYLREEDVQLHSVFNSPPNVFDRYETAHAVALKKHCDDRLELINRLTATCEERLDLINQLNQTCIERNSIINRLSDELDNLRKLYAERLISIQKRSK